MHDSADVILAVLFNLIAIFGTTSHIVLYIVKEAYITTIRGEPITRHVTTLFFVFSSAFAFWTLLILFMISHTIDSHQGSYIVAECVISAVIATITNWLVWRITHNLK
jgi:uncharacterized membrane protein